MSVLPLAPLRPRELEIVLAAAAGETAAETAERLYLGTQTIRFHRRNALAKLQARNMTEAVAIAFRAGLIE